MLLDKFDVKGRTKQASGGIAGQLHMNRPGYASGELAGWEFKTPDKKLREFTPEEIEKQRELLRDMLKKQKEFEDSLGVSYSKEMPEEQPPFQGPDYETNIPKEAGKEIIRRIIGSGVTGAPIGGGFSLDVPYGEGEDFDFGIGYKTDPRYGGITGGYGINLDGDDTMGIGYQGDNFGGGVKKQEGADSVYTGGYQGDNFEIGVSKEEGSEPYFTFKKKLKKKKKPIFGKAKGGLQTLNQGGRAGFANGTPAVDPRMLQSYEQNKAENEAQRQINQAIRDPAARNMNPDAGLSGLYKQYNLSGTRYSPGGAETARTTSDPRYLGVTGDNYQKLIKAMASQMMNRNRQTTTAPDLSKQSEAFGKMIMQKLEGAYGKPEDYRAEAATLNMPVATYMDYLMTRDEKGIHDKYMHLDPYYYQYKDDLVSEDPSNRPPSPLEAYYQKELQGQIDQGIPEAERIQKGQVLGPPGMIPTSGTMLSAYGYVPYEDALARTKTEMGLAKGGLAKILGV